MTVLLWTVAIIAGVLALFAARRSRTLRKELDQLKRDFYYANSRMKRVPEEIREAVQPLRLHLAKIAAGGAVPPALIRDGRLYQDVSAQEAQELLEGEGAQQPEGVVVVDVRTPREYAVRRVPGAKLIPFEELEKRYENEIPETADKIFVYCMAGERSRSACEFLGLKGYTNLYNIRDGLQAWKGSAEGEGQVQMVQIERRNATPAP